MGSSAVTIILAVAAAVIAIALLPRALAAILALGFLGLALVLGLVGILLGVAAGMAYLTVAGIRYLVMGVEAIGRIRIRRRSAKQEDDPYISGL